MPALRSPVLIGNGMTDPRAGPDRIECDNLRDADVCKSADEDAMRVLALLAMGDDRRSLR